MQTRQSGKTILVTGGGGFVGTNLISYLLDLPNPPDRILILDNFNYGNQNNLERFSNDPRVDIVDGDVRDERQVAAVTEKSDQVYHLSSIVGPGYYLTNPLDVIDINILGTRNVLKHALAKRIPVLFTSTSEVLGMNPKLPWKEDDDRVHGSTKVERWSYGSSKAVCEHMAFVLARSEGLQCMIIRFFNIYGPWQNPAFLISRGIHRTLSGHPPMTFDSGEHTRTFCYVDDAIRGMFLAANCPAASGEAIHIGSTESASVQEVNRIILEEAGLPQGVQPEMVETAERFGDRYQDIPHRAPDNSKARTMLGWQPEIELREGIRRFMTWAKENPWWVALHER